MFPFFHNEFIAWGKNVSTLLITYTCCDLVELWWSIQRCQVVATTMSLHTIQLDGTDDFPPGSTQWAVNIILELKKEIVTDITKV